MTELSSKTVQSLVAMALKKAEADYKRPICVSICDPYGFMLAFARMNGAPVRSIAISQGKAYTAARIGTDTRSFHERLQREKITSGDFCDDKLTAMPGGTVLKNKAGVAVGGVGVSGLLPSEDQEIADALAKVVAAEA